MMYRTPSASHTGSARWRLCGQGVTRYKPLNSGQAPAADWSPTQSARRLRREITSALEPDCEVVERVVPTVLVVAELRLCDAVIGEDYGRSTCGLLEFDVDELRSPGVAV